MLDEREEQEEQRRAFHPRNGPIAWIIAALVVITAARLFVAHLHEEAVVVQVQQPTSGQDAAPTAAPTPPAAPAPRSSVLTAVATPADKRPHAHAPHRAHLKRRVKPKSWTAPELPVPPPPPEPE